MKIYVDGACSNNGKEHNSGGFGVAIFSDDDQLIETYRKSCENTTNNREELKAILYAMIMFGKSKEIPNVYSDSAYAINSLENWMFNWAKNGWIKSDGNIPENLDLIKTYYDFYCKGYRIVLQKVKGHNGVYGNELADKLATGKEK